jgi:hypothetical protein
VISAVRTPPSAAAVTVTSAGNGCPELASRSSRRSSSTPLSTGNADCRRIASTVSRCSVVTEVLPFSLGWVGSALGPFAHVDGLLRFLPGPAMMSLAARQVSGHHRILVNRENGSDDFGQRTRSHAISGIQQIPGTASTSSSGPRNRHGSARARRWPRTPVNGITAKSVRRRRATAPPPACEARRSALA